MMTFYPVFFDIESAALNPIESPWEWASKSDAQVVTVGIGTFAEANPHMDTEELSMDIKVFENTGSEYPLLKDVRQYVRNKVAKAEGWWPYHEYDPGERHRKKEGYGIGPESFLISWNGRKFDHPYLGSRYARFRQDPFPFGYRRKRLDMMKSVRDKTGYVFSQDDWCEEKGIEMRNEITGEEVPEMWEKGRTDKIKTHCYSDLEDMMRLFHKDWEHHMEVFYDHYDIVKRERGDLKWA